MTRLTEGSCIPAEHLREPSQSGGTRSPAPAMGAASNRLEPDAYQRSYHEGRRPRVSAILLMQRRDRLRGTDVIAGLRAIPEITLCYVVTGSWTCWSKSKQPIRRLFGAAETRSSRGRSQLSRIRRTPLNPVRAN